ncbi:MAG: LPS assembly lipoprotein LptE [Arenicellales bacterium]|jgi:LPS-assembly lipoprotein|nr:LPS assembly lipoprotein LptE [Arenicellales bacterium]MDP6791372.1 LPS assembly lipoprotein LptE [Arenicellales bacterium]MDP6919307.1 LPS assembly lipoprotein LptE [Arenicellales bacterium]|tara:strand:- start:294 stop:815 length:522 start_codon:yes stop_codon:yes gene_type:complete
MMRTLTAILLSALLAGCGFHLRGQVQLAPVMSAPWVTGQNQALVMDLRTALRQSGVQPVKDAASATVIIDLATVEYTRAVKSVDSQGTATGYTLEYEVLYRVVDRLGRVLVENTSLSFTRDLVYKSTELLQKKQEEEALKISMRQEIVRRIIRRLGGVAFNRQAPEGSGVVFV